MRLSPYLCYEKILNSSQRIWRTVKKILPYFTLSDTLEWPTDLPWSYILGGKKTQKKTGEVPL